MRPVLIRNMYALDAITGNQLWQFEADSPIVAAPAISGKYLYAVCDKGTLYKLDLDTGKKISSVPVGFTVYGTPMPTVIWCMCMPGTTMFMLLIR